jgi:hypothetical protein
VAVSSLLLWSKIALLITAAFLIRPSALGQNYTVLGVVLQSVALFLHLVEALLLNRLVVSKNSLTVTVLVAGLWLYLLVQAAVAQSQGLENVIKASIVHLVTIFVFGLILGDAAANRAFFRLFVVVLSLLGASALITTLLSLFVPLGSLYLGHIGIEGYEYRDFIGNGDLYFPFSLQYGLFGDALWPRFMGLFTEPGILQAFALWAVVYVLNEPLPRLTLIPLISGVMTALSTAGVALLPATLLFWMAFRTRIDTMIKPIFALAGGSLAVIAFLYTPVVGASDKMEVYSVSLTARLYSTVQGLSLALEHPFGVGLYDVLVDDSGINLLAVAGQIGVVGFLLVIAVFVAPLLTNTNPAAYGIAMFPIFVTSLVSQPLLDAPLVYVMLLARFAPTNRASKQEEQKFRAPQAKALPRS